MSNERTPVIVSAARTAIGGFGGTLAKIPATELGAVAIRAAVERAGVDPGAIDEVFMGSVVPAGLGQAPARQASIKAGIPAHVGAVTLNKVCGSGLKTAMMAAGLVKAGDGDVYVAGGMENMNMAPYLLQQGRTGYRLGHGQVLDACVHDGLWCAFEDQHMGLAAEWIAEAYGVSREEQDQFALESHQKAIAAIDAGRFKEEIVPIEIPQRKGEPIIFDTDESPRRDTSLERLARLRPVFKKGRHRNRGQRLSHHRWRGGCGDYEPGQGDGTRHPAPGPHYGLCLRRGRTDQDLYRTGSCSAESHGKDWPDLGRL